jgi:hypothetical protein
MIPQSRSSTTKEKALQLGVPLIWEEEFLKMVRG